MGIPLPDRETGVFTIPHLSALVGKLFIVFYFFVDFVT